MSENRKDTRQHGASRTPSATPPVIAREQQINTPDMVTGIDLADQGLALWWDLYAVNSSTPEWASFKPFNHPALLPHAATFEKQEGRIRCGLVGDAIREELELKIAGSFIDETMPAANLADATKRLEQAMQTGKPNFVVKTMAWQPGYSAKQYCSLQLPFLGKDGTATRVIVIVSFKVE